MPPHFPGHALVVAIADYRAPNGLPRAVANDGHDIASVLISPDRCGYAVENVELLVDQEATLAALRNGLERLAARAGPNDTAAIFFSGHGALLGTDVNSDSALIPVDFDLHAAGSAILTEAEFSAALDKIKAARLLVLLDACHSAGAGRLKGAQVTAHAGFSEKSLSRLSQGQGRVIMASSRAAETSQVFNGARNSVFTTRLLEALRGEAGDRSDGLVRVFQTFNHVSQTVRIDTSSQQHPIFKASLQDDFPIALAQGGSKSLSPERERDKISIERLETILSELYPAGPLEEEIWARAGGDVSRLTLGRSGRALWFSAVRLLRQGGGGREISLAKLVETTLSDFPHHPQLVKYRCS
jgi:metacaspase-1